MLLTAAMQDSIALRQLPNVPEEAAEIAREKAQAARELMLVLARTKEQAEELLSSRTFIT